MEINKDLIIGEDLPLGARNFLNFASTKSLSFREGRLDEARFGYIKMSVPINEETTNPYGMIHGGILFTLADSVAGLTCISMNKKVVTLNSNINFLKSATKGYVHAEPRIIHNGKTTVLMEVDMKDDEGNLLSKASITMFVIGDMKEYEE